MVSEADAGIAGAVAIVYGSKVGIGGLGLQVGNAIRSLTESTNEVHAIGPGCPHAALAACVMDCVRWYDGADAIASTRHRFWLRWLHGRRQYLADSRLGRWAARQAASIRPAACYCFTQVALETLAWAKSRRIPTVLESPNGHLRSFREVYVREARELCAVHYLGHPSPAMVKRVEQEYVLADRIRVSSDWARDSLTARGVPSGKIVVIPQRADLTTFQPPTQRLPPHGPLRICFVGTFDLRKGFVYLLRAVRQLGSEQFSLRMVGGTVDRTTRRLLARETIGLNIQAEPGDPHRAYSEAEVFVLPTLEDGSPFVVAEAMAAGLAVIVTDQSGNKNLVTPGRSGWIVPARSPDALSAALAEALERRHLLPEMGRLGRTDLERATANTAKVDIVAMLFGGSDGTAPSSTPKSCSLKSAEA